MGIITSEVNDNRDEGDDNVEGTQSLFVPLRENSRSRSWKVFSYFHGLEDLLEMSETWAELLPDQLRTEVCRILGSVQECQEGDFAAGGVLKDAPPVTIRLEKTGELLEFPLEEEKAKAVIPSFNESPFGKGTETVIDKSVRSSWQLDPPQFNIVGGGWGSYLENMLASTIGRELGISSPITASIYKMLLYEPGSFFKAHRDTAKEKGMFGTLVIQLCSEYEGGEFNVRHDQMEHSFDFSASAQPSAQKHPAFIAFYCDCEHEIFPVTSGYRLCLIYNLSAPFITQMYSQPRFDELKEEVKGILKKWPIEDFGDEVTMLLYLLSHKYSKKELSFPSLKTTDQLKAKLLTSVASEVNLSIHVCLITRRLYGYTGYEPENEDDVPSDCSIEWDCAKSFRRSTVCKVFNLISPSGLPYPYGRKFVFQDGHMEENILPENAFDKVKPVSLEINPTGNQGTSVEKWYQEAALFFWTEKSFDFYGMSPPEKAEARFLEALKKLEGKPNSEEGIREATEEYLDYEGDDRGLYFEPERVIKSFNSLEMVKRFLQTCSRIRPEDAPILKSHLQLEGFGLENFIDEFTKMVTKSYEPCSLVAGLLGQNLDLEKQDVLLKPLLRVMLKKNCYVGNSDQRKILFELIVEVDDLALFKLLLEEVSLSDGLIAQELVYFGDKFGWNELVEPFGKSLRKSYCFDTILTIMETITQLSRDEEVIGIWKNWMELATLSLKRERSMTSDRFQRVLTCCAKLELDLYFTAISLPHKMVADALLGLAAASNEKKLREIWIPMASHCMHSLEEFLSLGPTTGNWHRNDDLSVLYAECEFDSDEEFLSFADFMQSNDVTYQFRMQNDSRHIDSLHELKYQFDRIGHLSHELTVTKYEGQSSINLLKITKVPLPHREMERRQGQAKEMLEKLKLII